MAAGIIITVIGGVRSGKTSWSEQEAEAFQIAHNERRLVYLASGVAFDKEMNDRIARHQKDRGKERWVTIEQPVKIGQAGESLQQGDVVVWDCLTTWLANESMDRSEALTGAQFRSYLHHELDSLIQRAKSNLSICFIVSNEVLHEPVFEEGMTAHYQKNIGVLHQWLVQQSDVAIEMEAGIPLIRKGKWPV